MVTSFFRGHKIVYINNAWYYLDNEESVDFDNSRPCFKRGKSPTSERYDFCLGHIEGAISACCGHGQVSPYIIKGF